jgi:hypothetical protein
MKPLCQRPSILLLVFCVGLLLPGCGAGLGKKLTFNAGELYYTGNVTEDQAKKLGDYLVKEGFFDGNRKTVQLDKNGDVLQFRFVVKESFREDEKFLKTIGLFSHTLSKDVFDGAKVEVHVCDEHMKTLKVLSHDLGTELTFNGNQLFYTAAVTEEQAKKLGEYLVKDGYFEGDAKSVQLDKQNGVFQVRLVVKEEIVNDANYEGVVKLFREQIQKNVFNGEQTEIHYCDEFMDTVRVIGADPASKPTEGKAGGKK